MSKCQDSFSQRKKQSGQMAVFVALIFQVLFVFFAMAINIGLVVHDKINLQNAVDLAAYYTAQRQSEWLNVIAHQNYQIRQSYKLLTWRYRVLGTMGLSEGTPHPSLTGDIADEPFVPAVSPAACVAYQPVWQDIASGRDTLCKREADRINIPEINISPVIAPFNPINAIFRNFAQNMQGRILQTCDQYGGYNFLYVNFIKAVFREDQLRLKRSIRAIAQNLAQPMEQMIDLDGQPVAVGAQKTLQKNLTFANNESLQGIRYFNSIEGRNVEEWLNEVKINLSMLYQDVIRDNGCVGDIKLNHELPSSNRGIALIEERLGISSQEAANLLIADPPASDLASLSLGYEKNPWMRLYSGVRARTRPRQLFFPFGDPVQFEAVGYASPFGGRIGPWYHDRWQQGAPASDGNEVDRLVPPLLSGNDNAVNIDAGDAGRLLPNYSRYLGDRFGLSSKLGQAALRDQQNGIRGRLSDLSGVLATPPTQSLDVASWNDIANATTPMRNYEVAAVAPDIFDAMFYSIEPNYGRTYFPKLQRLFQNGQVLPQDAPPRLDIGGRLGSNELAEFSVADQMALAGSQFDSSGVGPATQNLHRSEAFYFLRDRSHLLTSWVHSDTLANFDEFPSNRFATCETWDDEYRQKIPGSCLYNGGRTGYSVKIISGDFLRADDVQYGGAGQRGPLINPPPEEW